MNVHWLRGGLGALDSLTSRAQSDYSAHAQSLLFDCVKYPMGQLVNAIVSALHAPYQCTPYCHDGHFAVHMSILVVKVLNENHLLFVPCRG